MTVEVRRGFSCHAFTQETWALDATTASGSELSSPWRFH